MVLFKLNCFVICCIFCLVKFFVLGKIVSGLLLKYFLVKILINLNVY